MGHLSLEVDERTETRSCPSCGGEIRLVRGIVREDGEPRGLYMAELADRGPRHTEVRVRLVIGLVDLGRDVADRRHVASMEVWPTEKEVQMGLVNRADSPWVDEEQWLGRIMDRAEVLSSPLKDEFFHTAEHIVTEDPRIRAYLSG